LALAALTGFALEVMGEKAFAGEPVPGSASGYRNELR
jgi:hypothetical protein